MQFASKLNFSIPVNLINDAGKSIVNYGTVFDLYTLKKRRDIIALLPKELQNESCAFLTHISFDRGLDEAEIHTHTKEKCVLNYYIEANDEETSFYDGQELIVPMPYGKSSFVNKLNISTLKKVEAFTAKNGEAWLLKTNKPHRVLSTKKTGIRKMIQIYFFNSEYEKIKKILGEYYG